MADSTHIQWTDATWNPITGCSVVSAGCKNCYAMRLAGGRLRNHPSRVGLTRVTGAGRVWTGEVRLNTGWLDQPLRWRRPRRIFVCAHGDLFHPAVSDEWIDRVFAVMALAPQHTFQVLTKRPARMREYISNLPSRASSTPARAVRSVPYMDGSICEFLRAARPGSPSIDRVWPLSNVWLGVSVEDQDTANERIPFLLRTPAAVLFISAEPLLGPIDLADIPRIDHEHPHPLLHDFSDLDWVIVGGESGRGARPCEVDWIRDIVRQCREEGVPCFVKQLGAHPIAHIDEAVSGSWATRKLVLNESEGLSGPRVFLRSRAGSDPAEWPADLRIREFPPCHP